MKRFIRYLYEYQQGRRLRNVGFVKVEQGEDECAVHIHGKGLHMKGERKLSLYLFYEEGDECVGIWQGDVDNVNPAINYRLYYTKEDTGMPGNFQRINGIILTSETGHRYAAVWDDMPVDIEHMRIWRQRPEGLEERMRQEVEEREAGIESEEMPARQMPLETMPQENAPSENMPLETMPQGNAPSKNMSLETMPQGNAPSENMPLGNAPSENMPLENDPSIDEDAGERTEEAESANSRQEIRTDDGREEVQTMEKEDMEEAFTEGACEEQSDSGDARPISFFQCTKIQRSELSRLPRCEWKWANNSFLLHGYYNYHHLVLLDDGAGLRLGVPGIYHPQEAKAASAFGFAEFIPVRDIRIELTEEERNDQEQFGYWCRWVRRQK